MSKYLINSLRVSANNILLEPLQNVSALFGKTKICFPTIVIISVCYNACLVVKYLHNLFEAFKIIFQYFVQIVSKRRYFCTAI